jgi:hypothetical protein
MFSEKEISYLQSQRLARIAAVSANGEPDVAPVLFTFDGNRFLVGGIELGRTLKYTNTQATGRAAIVVDNSQTQIRLNRGESKYMARHGSFIRRHISDHRSTSRSPQKSTGAGESKLLRLVMRSRL